MRTGTETIIEPESITTQEISQSSIADSEVSLLDITVLMVRHKRFVVRFVLGAALYSASTLDGLEQPWTLLAKRLQAFEVRGFPWVGLYIASGRA